MFLITEGRHRILREVVTVIALTLCAVTMLALQYQVCVYWLPNDSRFSNVTWDEDDRIRFGNLRVVDWRTGTAWLDPSKDRNNTISLTPSPDLRVEVQPAHGYPGPCSYRVTYIEAHSNLVLTHFDLNAENALQPDGRNELFVFNDRLALPAQIDRIDFPPSGPKISTITLPPPPQGSNPRNFQFLGMDRTRLIRACQLLPTAATTKTTIGSMPWRLELFEVEGATACQIASWRCPSTKNVYVDGDYVASFSEDGTQLEVRDRNGLRLRSEPAPWMVDWKPGDTIHHTVQFGGRGFIEVMDTTTDKRTYFDAMTLQVLPVKDSNSWIQNYDRQTGCVVATSNQHIAVSWRDGNRPAFSIELDPKFEGVEVATRGSLIVAADYEYNLRFVVIDTDQQTFEQFDLRMRRVWAIAATILMFCLGCSVWVWSSLRWRCPVWLDLLVIGGAFIAIYGFSALMMGRKIDEMTSIPWYIPWYTVTFVWILVSSLWLAHGERSFVFRLSIHLIVISFILIMTAHLASSASVYIAGFLLMAIVLPTVYLAIGVAIVRGLQARDRNAPSKTLKITDLLLLMASLSAFLLSVQWDNDYAGAFVILDELMELVQTNWAVFIAIAAVCLGFSIAILAPYRTRASSLFGLVFIVLLVSLCSAIAIPILWYPIDQSRLIAVGVLALGHVLSMFLLRWHGWRFRWRWGTRSVSNSGMTG